MTTREKLERKASLREDWAAKRKQRATSEWKAAHSAVEGIEFGQPILIGHHSEKKHRRALERSDQHSRHAVESMDMADLHAGKASGLRDALDRSIYSDDDNAIAAIQARIDEREAEASRIKAYNATCRAAAKRGETHGDLSLLDEKQRQDLLGIARVCSYQLGEGGQFPGYVLSNLRGNITSDKKRIEEITRREKKQAAAADSETGFVVTGGEEYVSITFAEKPEREIINALKDSGFYWQGGSWHGKRADMPNLSD